MKWFRTLKFSKKRNYIGEDTYTTANDSGIIATILEKANYYGLEIISLEVDNFFGSSVELWGGKKEFFRFVEDFTKEYKDYIQDIRF